ncbi:MAG TPA: TlpA disulfide reductase family protein [Acidiferrobacter sp.]|nr:TlpA disulfide reductase family protein [Acidiferrobacter sp.]
MTKRAHLVWAALVVCALGGGYWLGARSPWTTRNAVHRHEPPAVASNTEPQQPPHRFRFVLPDLSGKMRSLSHWPARVYLVNFWAPWCPPCRAEVPLLIQAANKDRHLGLVVVGIALDHKNSVVRFVHDHGITYPVLLGGEKGLEMLGEFGDMQGAIPFSVFVTPHGRILTGQLGAFSPDSLKQAIAYALKSR